MSFQSNYEANIRKYPKNPLLHQNTDEYPLIKGENGILYDKNSYMDNSQQNTRLIQLTTKVPTTLFSTTGSKIEFILTPDQFRGRYNNAFIHINVTPAASMMLNCLRLFKITVYDSFGEVIQVLNGLTFYLNYLSKDHEKRKRFFQMMGFEDEFLKTADYSKVLTAATAYDFYIPLCGFFMDHTDYPLFACGNIKIALESNTEYNQWCTSGTYTGLVCNTCDLYIIENEIPYQILDKYQNTFLNNTVCFNTLSLVGGEQNETLTNSTNCNIQMSNVVGMISGLLFGVRSNANNFQSENWADLKGSTIKLQSSSSQSFFFDGELKVEHIRNMMMDSLLGNYISKYTNLLFIPFGKDLKNSLENNNSSGVRLMDGTDKLILKVGATGNNLGEVSSTWTIKSVIASTGVGSPATGGYHIIQYSSRSGTKYSAPIAFNETNTNIDIQLKKLVNDDNLIVSSATGIDDAAGLVITVSNFSYYNKKYGDVDSIHFNGISCGCFDATPSVLELLTTEAGTQVAQSGIYAASASSCIISLYGIRVSNLYLEKNKLKVHHLA